MDRNLIEHDLLGSLWSSPDLMETLGYLCDDCESRFAGTEDERRAGDYMMARFRAYGLKNVGAEPFEMRGWERGPVFLAVQDGERWIEMPACLALPGSQGCDLEAEIINLGAGTASDFERAGAAVAGKIVLTSSDGPSRGDKYQSAIDGGAVAFLFANAQPGFLAPTGSIEKDLPAAGLAYEHAARMRRLLKKGSLKAHLRIEARVLTVTARNIVAEIPGSDPDQGWIVACGHYDGHDVSQGAQDNAAASAILVETARLLAPVSAQLKIGIRFVLFSGEELGLFGSHAYVRDHADQMNQVRLVFNADVVGMAMPLVLRTQASPELAGYLRSLPLDVYDCTVNDGPGSYVMNSDHFPFTVAGLQAVWALTSHPSQESHWIHTAADTLDKVEERVLRQSAAALLRVLWQMSSNPQDLPRVHRSPEEVRQQLVAAGFENPMRKSGRWPI
jgi:aminopeptidase YwaD